MLCPCRSTCPSKIFGQILPLDSDKDVSWTLESPGGKEIRYVVHNPLLPVTEAIDCIFVGKASSKVFASPAWGRPEASWKKMLVTQPALRGFPMDNCGARHFHAVHEDEWMGVTMGDCVEAARGFEDPGWSLVTAGVEQVSEETAALQVLERVEMAGKELQVNKMG